MYDVSDVLPVGELSTGTNLLITGPPMSGKYDLLTALLADGVEDGEAGLMISTGESAQQVRDDVGARIDGDPGVPLGIVDTVSQERGIETGDDPFTKYVSSPSDFTGAGMATSELLEEFGARDVGVRAALHSVSELLMYADVETVFRFLHVLTGRISSADAVGFATLDADTHDEQTVNTVQQLFDGLVETRMDDDGRECRIRGLSAAGGDWQSF